MVTFIFVFILATLIYTSKVIDIIYVKTSNQRHGGTFYSDSKNPFHTNLNGGARSAPPNTVGIALSLGGVKNRKYSWLQDCPLGHVILFTHRWDMANPKQ